MNKIKGILFFIFCYLTAYATPPEIPYVKSIENPEMRKIISIYQTKSGDDWITAMSQLLDNETRLLQWQGKQIVPLQGTNKILHYLQQENARYPNLQKQIGRVMVAGGGVGGNAILKNNSLILFYIASTQQKEKNKIEWAGCDVITLSHGKIIDWRIEEDTYMKLVKHPSHIDMQNEYHIIDKYWHPETTTHNLVGMSYLLDLKRTVMPTQQRGELLLQRIKDNVEQSTWEPKGILLLKGKPEVKAMFFDGLLDVLPDFYENVERTLVAGNAFIMLQNPSGTSTFAHKTNHRAWYNCDIFFFDGNHISALLFQRDTQMDIAEEQRGQKNVQK